MRKQQNILGPDGKKFIYDAAESSNRRRQYSVTLGPEDKELSRRKRDILTSDTRNVYRNSSICRYAIEKHLDFVATFNFQSRSGDARFDDDLESLVEWWSRPFNFDASGRFSRQKFIRLVELAAVTDGDIFGLKLDTGHVQAIEGDRVRTPERSDFKRDEWCHGIRTDDKGRLQAICVCNRTGEDYQVIPGQFIHQHGYFHRFDQLRGISPLTSALDTFKDIHEANTYALARMKVQSLFALAMTRDGTDAIDGDTEAPPDAAIDFNKGPIFLDLSPGESASFLESSQPSSQFQDFLVQMTQAAFKALDIPMVMFDESRTNYSGARAALLLYQQSIQVRRMQLQQLLDNLLVWRILLWIEEGVLKLPAGKTISSLKWIWQGLGLPSIDPLKEVQSDIAAIENKLTSRQSVCKARGEDWFDVLNDLAKEEQAMRDAGLSASQVDAATVSNRGDISQ